MGKAYNRLTIRQRLYIWHMKESGMTLDEIAAEMGCDDETARAVLARSKPVKPKNRPDNACPVCGRRRNGLGCAVCRLLEIRRKDTRRFPAIVPAEPPGGLELRGADKVRYYALRRKSGLDE